MTNAIKLSPVDIEARKKLKFSSGDTVKVWSKIQEKGKTRLQAFEGMVLARKHGTEIGATFTVRRVASGVGVEKIFPLYSFLVDKIEVTKQSKARRSKLYYIRDKAAKAIRRKIKLIRSHPDMDEEETESEPELETETKVEEAEVQAEESTTEVEVETKEE